jgi:hypothetical protein
MSIADYPTKLLYNRMNLLETFPKLNDALEILFTLNSLKPVARLILDEGMIPKIHYFCEITGLYYMISDFKILPDQGVAVDPKKVNVRGNYFVYFSMDLELAKKAKFYEHMRNDRKIGELMGYPDCCIDFYLKNYDRAKEIGDEYSLFSLENSSFPMPFYTNNLLRFFGITLISHFPCSFNCEKSVEMGEIFLNCVEYENKDVAAFLRRHLSSVVMSHVGSGVHVFSGAALNNDVVSYSNVWLTSPNQVHDLLKQCNRIEIIDKNHLRFYNGSEFIKEFSGKDVGLMVFV